MVYKLYIIIRDQITRLFSLKLVALSTLSKVYKVYAEGRGGGCAVNMLIYYDLSGTSGDKD